MDNCPGTRAILNTQKRPEEEEPNWPFFLQPC